MFHRGALVSTFCRPAQASDSVQGLPSRHNAQCTMHNCTMAVVPGPVSRNLAPAYLPGELSPGGIQTATEGNCFANFER